jgi:hypothetical protein
MGRRVEVAQQLERERRARDDRAEMDLEQRLDRGSLEPAGEALELGSRAVAQREVADGRVVPRAEDAKARTAERPAGVDQAEGRVVLIRADVAGEPRDLEAVGGAKLFDPRRVPIDRRGAPMVLAVHPPLDAVVAVLREVRAHLLRRQLRQHPAEHAELHAAALPEPAAPAAIVAPSA